MTKAKPKAKTKKADRRQITFLMAIVEHKTCTKCAESKPFNEFPRPRERRGGIGHKGVCKACWNSYNATYRPNAEPKAPRVRPNRAVQDRESRQRKGDALRALVDEAKAVPCMDCGERHPTYVMDLDHRPGEVKEFSLAEVRRGQHRVDQVIAEIAKCDVVCANCHRKRTFARRREAAAGASVLSLPPRRHRGNGKVLPTQGQG